MSEVVFSGIDRMVNTQVRPLTTDDYHRMIETGIIPLPLKIISENYT